MGTCLQQVLAGFERYGEGFDVATAIRLRSDELRQSLGIDEHNQAKKGQAHHRSGQTRDVLSAWGKDVADALPPSTAASQRGRSSHRPASSGGGMDSLYRGGQEEVEMKKGKKRPDSAAHGKQRHGDGSDGGKQGGNVTTDLFRGGTFEYTQQKRKTGTARQQSDPWSAETEDDRTLQRALGRSLQQQERARKRIGKTNSDGDTASRVFGGARGETGAGTGVADDPLRVTGTGRARRSRPASAARETRNRIFADANGGAGVDEHLPRGRRITNPAAYARTDPWSSTATHVNAYQKR
ncbi:hypothetical protein PTSG_12759 [Salpingoeca rosetta]|uniref:Uncharacterized protein n=1 Tax=Salpingoeca rosetta (strain ATCC 50818 / BSB-021) TaxID=946362 RepID=F2UK46_SALR5|nr:uncharacterized protein PTSG_12759 [Salpingoeca rosetta]EGD77495.1 hypothetical protein PTSG_12759 [Salpingoeca rosetta]|eukprot:XP_004990383.1 hypothetical protein PTSG_12759 [Salpingoeca rosetta]